MKPAKPKPFIRRAGGKRLLAPRLLERMPPHKVYVEAFGGGGALLFARPKVRGVLEVYNDIDGELVNAFRQVREHGPEVIRCLEHRINARADFQRARQAQDRTEVQRAADLIFRNRLSFGGDNDNFGVQRSLGGGAANSLANGAATVAAASVRLDGVIVECLPWERLFKNYDGPDTFWFLDPPYLGGSQKAYPSWQPDQWEAFAAGVAALKGRWIVTSGNHDVIRTLFSPVGTIEEWDRSLSLAKGTRGEKSARYVELVIFNRRS